MSHPLHHAISSVKKYGGHIDDYLPIHNWFDESKKHFPDMRHRSMRHHTEGIFWCEERFGVYITNTDGKMIPTRFIGEQHIKEDMGFIPTMKQYLDSMKAEVWMFKGSVEGRKLMADINDEHLDNK